MIGYVTLGVSDIERAKTFYIELLKDLGAKLVFDGGRIAFIGTSIDQPMVAVCTPYDEQPAHPGNGNMLAITVPSKEAVETMYKTAIELGATCDGEPGQRRATIYGAYVLDQDGNKLAFYVFG